MPAAPVRWTDPDALPELAARLQAGALVGLPTETLYGLSCRAADALAVARLATLKGIATARGFVALVAESQMALRMAPDVDDRGAAFLNATWPAPLTAVLPVREAVAWGEARQGIFTAAFRVPALPWLRHLLALVGEAVVSTSANRTGERPLNDPKTIAATFAALDVIVVGEPVDSEMEALPSTVADFTTWPPRVLRPGRFDLTAALGVWNG